MRHRDRYIFALTLAVALSACAISKKAGNSVGLHGESKFSLQVNVSATANDNNPIPMDLVMVLDKKIDKEVSKLSAKDWFTRRIQIGRDFPDKVEIVSWEWVPGEASGPIAVAVSPKAVAGYLFADYLQAGDNRAAVDLRYPVAVTLSEKSFTIQSLH
jgi:hypothetical protein